MITTRINTILENSHKENTPICKHNMQSHIERLNIFLELYF